jgi:Tol biopolymer transport system component
VIVALAALGWAFRPTPPAPPAEAVRFEVPPPDNGRFDMYVALSPDGRHLAYRAIGEDGVNRAWVRDMNTLVPRVLPGTEGAGSLTWSPDSRYLAFAADRQLKRIDIRGGPPQTLCEVPFPVGSGTWSDDGTILFGGRGAGPLHRVSAAGGDVTPVTSEAGGFSSFPQFLPDNRHFIYYRSGPVTGIFVGSLDARPEAQPTDPLMSSDFGAVLERTDTEPGGRLLFVRGSTLMVQPFDVTTRTLVGRPVPFVEGIATVNQYVPASTSRTGALAFRTGPAVRRRTLAWFDRDGKSIGGTSPEGEYVQLTLSPDGTRIVFRDRALNSEGDLWLLDLAKGTTTRFTFSRSATGNHSPVWSPDGQRVAFVAADGIYQRLANGAADAELIVKTDRGLQLDSWSRDGEYIFLTMNDPGNGRRDIGQLRMADRSVSVWLKEPANEREATLSPDGKWVAYTSDESGRSELFVRPFDRAGAGQSARWQISRDGAIAPLWRADSKELFFKDLTGVPVAVPVSASGNALDAGVPQRLPIQGGIWPSWGVTGDGKRFVVALPPPTNLAGPITVILNWASEIQH